MHQPGPTEYPAHQLSQRGYDNLQIFLITLLIVQETGVPYVLQADSEVDADAPKRLHLQLLLFISVNQSFLTALLFFLFGRLDQRTLLATAHNSVRPGRWVSSAGLQRLLPAIASKLLLQIIQLAVPPTVDTSSFQASTVNPIVILPVILLSFDFGVSLLLQLGGAARTTTYLEEFQKQRRWIVPVYWLLLIETEFFVRSIFPVDVLSVSAFRLTDIPQYFFAYIWGRLAVSTRDVYIFALIPPVAMPICSMAVSVLFSNLALLDLLSLAIPNLSKNDVLSKSVQAALGRMGGSLSPHAAMYCVWKELTFTSIAPALLATFIEHTDQDFWVTIPGIGRRPLKQCAYASLLFYMPVSRLLKIFIDTISIRVSGGTGVTCLLEFHGSIAPGLVIASLGSLNALLAWTVGCVIVEYVPYAGQTL